MYVRVCDLGGDNNLIPQDIPKGTLVEVLTVYGIATIVLNEFVWWW